MLIGSYSELSLSKARETAKELSARVALGYDVAAEKQERKAEALAKMEAEKNAMRVSDLASEYFEARYFRDGNIPISFAGELIRILTPALGI
ncbi:integrase [Escherichia coli]|nr:integrase [Escherichia coli]